EDKRPQLSDLRESGSIEQDADVVLFVFREEYYLENRKPREGNEEFLAWQQKMTGAHGKAEIIIGKQRHGPTGTVELQFQADVTRFANVEERPELPPREDPSPDQIRERALRKLRVRLLLAPLALDGSVAAGHKFQP